MFNLMKKRASYLKGGGGKNTSDADFHRKLAAHHSAISAEHSKMAGEEHEEPVEEETEAGSPYEAGEDTGAPAILAGGESENPPDTVETAEEGPPEDESKDSYEHEAGETAEVEEIEEEKKKKAPPPKGGRSFRPFKKGGSFKF